MDDLVTRIINRVQLTTDGFKPYMDAVEWAFGSDVDFAQLIKLHAHDERQRGHHSPSESIGAVPVAISGNPDPKMISTSHVERNNLTLRTLLRRLSKLSLRFSKKLDNLKHAVALHFAYHNFYGVHKNLRVTPVMEAGITEHIWTFAELLEMS